MTKPASRRSPNSRNTRSPTRPQRIPNAFLAESVRVFVAKRTSAALAWQEVDIASLVQAGSEPVLIVERTPN
ncbi:MAG: hypothetical protein MUC55_05585 [Burkholderiales bacterium]|jgi:hypothetical protein|nr:hypothetical protein [Burkholderiales bacterium]